MAAFTLNSKEYGTLCRLEDLYHFMSDFSNFKSILPEDKVEGFTSSGDQCSFTIRGITPMTVKLAEKTPCSRIRFTSEGLGKFNFELIIQLMGEQTGVGKCRVDLSGDLNPIILSFAKDALQQMADTMSLKLSQLNEEALKK